MTSRLNPYLSFDGTTRSAMEFYQSVFGGDLSLNTYGEFGNKEPALADKVMHGMLETPSGFTLMGADAMEKAGANSAVSLSGDDADELRGYWEKLSDGGAVSVPMEKQVWGDIFGMCNDKYGITWMVNIVAPR